MNNKILKTLFIAFILVLIFGGICANAETISGTLDVDNINWSLDDNGTLTFTSNVSIPDFSENEVKPWGNNENVKNLVFLGNIQSIGEYAFENCVNLESVTFSENCKFIGKSAFKNCTSLKEVVFNDSTYIYESAFEGCGLSKITFGKGVSLSNNSFKNCNNITEIHFNGDLTMNFSSENIPFYNDSESTTKFDVYFEDDVTKVPDYLFYKNKNLQKIEFNNVETVGNGAFYECENLSVMSVKNLETIEKTAFYGCKSLTTLQFGKAVGLGISAFQNCTKIRGITFSKNIKVPSNSTSAIFGNVGAETSGLTVVFKDNVTEIPDYLFYNNKNLTTLRISDNLATVRRSAFEGCTKLKEINLNNITEVKNRAFYGCSFVETLTASKLENIGTSAFEGCKKISKVELDSIKEIGGSAFDECSSLKEVYLGVNCSKVTIGAFPDNEEIVIYCYGESKSGMSFRNNLCVYYNYGRYDSEKESEMKFGYDESGNLLLEMKNCPYDSTVIVAYYENGCFKGIEESFLYRGKKFTSKTEKTYDEIRVFLWDSIEGMKPVCNVATFKEETPVTSGKFNFTPVYYE